MIDGSIKISNIKNLRIPVASVLIFPTLSLHMLTSDSSCGIREVSQLQCPVTQQNGGQE